MHREILIGEVGSFSYVIRLNHIETELAQVTLNHLWLGLCPIVGSDPEVRAKKSPAEAGPV